jgi:predicted MFS family arabinose efflux permease
MTAAALAKRNIALLAISQALYSCCVITVFATAGIAGYMLAPSPGWATAPITTFVIGSALAAIPASLLMQRFGRIPVFMLGAFMCFAGAALSTFAILTQDFFLFCSGTFLQGVFQSTSGFYRFAAVEGAPDEMKPLAISWVLTGGVVAAVVGTLIASSTSDLFAPATFAGSYLAVVVLTVIAMGFLLLLKLPKPTAEEVHGPRRSWSELLKQPRLIVAITSAALSYGMMNLMMTAAPIAMIGCGFDKNDASWVIQWHVLGMFVPSFFTGHLIKRFGAEKIAAVGMLLLISAAVIGLSGIAFANFAVALVLLGLGWNFGFIGGTTMLTTTYAPAERGKVQGANDFIMLTVVAFASLSSGKLLAGIGWASVNIALFPMAVLALALIVWVMSKNSCKAGNLA